MSGQVTELTLCCFWQAERSLTSLNYRLCLFCARKHSYVRFLILFLLLNSIVLCTGTLKSQLFLLKCMSVQSEKDCVNNEK